MALAIQFEGMLRDETIQDYAELARLGQVTRARITQMMKLRHLAPDIQEQILFLPNITTINERNLRPIVSRTDWREQHGHGGTLRGHSQKPSPRALQLNEWGLNMQNTPPVVGQRAAKLQRQQSLR
jgi:hypothetical protein